MPGYADTKQLIESTLTGRPAGTYILPEDHQTFALSLLDYIHAVELIGASSLQGIATTSTVPVQPANSKVSYIGSVPPGQTYVYANFKDENNQAISVTSSANTVSLITLLWNGSYWSVSVTPVTLAVDYSNGYLFMGMAVPTTNPGTPDQNVFYVASTAGTYTNFGGLTVADGEVAILRYNGSWTKDVTGAATKEELTRLNLKVDELAKNDFELYGGWMSANDGTYSNASTNGYIIVRIPSEVEFEITKPENFNAHFAFLKSYSGQPTTTFDITGTRRTLTSSTPTLKGTTPSDAKYLYILHKYSNTIWDYPSVIIGGVDYLSPVIDEIADLTKRCQLFKTLLDGGYMFAGIATPSTNPGTPTQKVFYIATQNGTYTNFGNKVITGLSVLLYDTTSNVWTYVQTSIEESPRWVQGNNQNISSQVSTEGKKFTLTPTIADSPAYRISGPIAVSAGDMVVVRTFLNDVNISAIISCTSDGTPLKSLVAGGVSTICAYPYYVNEAGYVRLCTHLTYYEAFIEHNAIVTEIKESIENAPVLRRNDKIFPNALLPCVSFQFDDIPDSDDAVVELFDELGVRCNFAFIASDANIQAKAAKYREWNRRGYGICSHSVDGTIFNTNNYTRETALAALQESKNKLEKAGMAVSGFVSPSSQMAADFFDLVEQTYGYAFTSTDGYANNRVGNPCRCNRQTMQSATLANCKGRIDIAIQFGYNLTFYGHSANFGTTYDGEEWNLDKVRAIVEYAIQKRDAGLLFIGNTDECMEYFYGPEKYNHHLTGDCGTILPKPMHKYYMHDVESATISYNANKLANCEILLNTAAGYTAGGITFGTGYKFNAVPSIGASETWHLKIMQGCIIATKLS